MRNLKEDSIILLYRSLYGLVYQNVQKPVSTSTPLSQRKTGAEYYL